MKAKGEINRHLVSYLSFVLLVWMMVYGCLSIDYVAFQERVRQEREAYEAYLADSVVTILVAGDVMGHAPQYQAAFNRVLGCYEYHDCFQYVEPYLKSVDLACANLEVTLGGKPYSSYPCFSSPDELLFELQNVGFDVLFTANNHVLDRGKSGLERTILLLDSVGMIHAGSYVDSASRAEAYPLVVDVKGLKVGFLNMTYGTNGLIVKEPNIVNSMDTLEVARDFERFAELDTDLEVVVIHWGIEYQLLANKQQRDYADFLVRHGADLIIGGHPHVSQDADTLFASDGKPVVTYYSLGNYVSNQRKPNTDGGIMVKADVNRFTGRVIATEYMPYYVHRGFIHGKYQFYIIPTIPYLRGDYDFHLPASDSIALVRVHEAMTGRLSNFDLWAE